MPERNPLLASLHLKLAAMRAAQERGVKNDTAMVLGMIKALEKAEADAAKKAEKVEPETVEEVDEVQAVEPVRSPIRLCLFDLDDTLLQTSDLDRYRGQENVGKTDLNFAYRGNLRMAYGDPAGRYIYTPEHHVELRAAYPEMKWGVFTRSPRLYAQTLLAHAYPGLTWDAIVAFEDVRHTKPHGDGIWAAIEQCDVKYVDEVALVGDDKIDVQAAYQGGCWSILDQSSWVERPWASQRYWAMEKLPDAVITRPSDLVKVLGHPKGFWPDLEYLSDSEAEMAGRVLRIDKINHFFPRPDNAYVSIQCLGRLFGEYPELGPRRKWHALTAEIHAHKEAKKFPSAWVEAIRRAIRRAAIGRDCVVTVIPFKPGRPPRLEALLDQVRASEEQSPIIGGMVYQYERALLAFREGAVSSHGQHLNRDERFANVEQNLYVAQPERAKGKTVIVIDDVITTGATLLWAHRYLTRAGARSVSCISLAKAVGIG